MRRSRATALAAFLLSLGGCGTITDAAYELLGVEQAGEDTDGFDTDWGERLDSKAKLDVGAVAHVEVETRLDLGTSVAEPTGILPLERAEALLPLPGHGATNMGFRVDQLADVFALAGAMEIPTWSAPSEGSPRATRDDDLDTAWTCVPNGEERCAIGMHLPGVAKVHSVRLFAAAFDFDEYPRPKRVRLHTEAGFTDALLADTNAPQFIELAEPVVSRNVVLEVLEVYPGKAREPKIHIADFEVFGVAGEAREPLQLDPASIITVPTSTPWRRAGRASYEARETFLHVVDEEGNMRRFMQGTALRGHLGDRLFLVERMSGQSDCDAPRGTFFLLDTKTRITAPLGDLDGIGGDTFRAADGSGIVIGFKGKLDTKLNGVFVDAEGYRRRQTPFRPDLRAGKDYFTDWQLESAVIPREPPPLSDPIEGCEVGTPALLAELEMAMEAAPKNVRKKRTRRRQRDEVDRPAAWQVCELSGGARAFITDHGPCGPQWEVTVLDGNNTWVATETDKADRAFVRVVPRTNHLLVQVGSGGDATSIWRVAADAITELAPGGQFALQPPAECRENCLEPFPNPGAPVWQ